MFFCAALVILMIIKFRFPKGKTIHQVIEGILLVDTNSKLIFEALYARTHM